MPTGYTAPLYEGKEISFDRFVMNCARAFGALVTMRDDPADAEIPEKFEADTSYHDQQLNQADEELEIVSAWDDETAEREAANSFAEQVERFVESEEKKAAMRLRYQQMLAQVLDWEPPTGDHEGLKKFMTDQLVESIEHDCPLEERSHIGTPRRMNGPEYREFRIASAQREIKHHTEQIHKEVERERGRTEWVQNLRDSLSVTVEP
jgi:hypothetical protein